MDILKNNAISTAQGFIYQNLVALDKCFELQKNQKLYIEVLGDITIEGLSQTEVKKVRENLTDLNISFWKTLKNWMDDKFQVDFYKDLILYTTQKIGANSRLLAFNSETADGKLDIIKEIRYEFFSKKDKKNEEIERYMYLILDSSKRDKLKSVLEKFIIIL